MMVLLLKRIRGGEEYGDDETENRCCSDLGDASDSVGVYVGVKINSRGVMSPALYALCESAGRSDRGVNVGVLAMRDTFCVLRGRLRD
jgi:hypothetical protein